MSAHVHRDNSRRITVEDPDGHALILISNGCELELLPSDPCPHLTAQMAHDLAEELHQWAYTQQTIRARR